MQVAPPLRYESNIWVLWESPTDKDDTRRCALR